MPPPGSVPAGPEALQERLGYRFRDPRLLELALTHPSYLPDHPEAGESNQRLEFLGDAVLQWVLTRRLFEDFPGEREGGLTRRRALLSRGPFLARLAREIGLESCLRLGGGEEASGGRTRISNLEDAFEALMGALFLDGGLEGAGRVALAIFGRLEERLAAAGDEGDNPKGRLQELVQPVHGNGALRYEVVGLEGADHARRYCVAVFLLDRELGRGRGPSKKAAEEEAAREALRGQAGPGA